MQVVLFSVINDDLLSGDGLHFLHGSPACAIRCRLAMQWKCEPLVRDRPAQVIWRTAYACGNLHR